MCSACCAVLMIAGHNALCGSGPGRNLAFDDAVALRSGGASVGAAPTPFLTATLGVGQKSLGFAVEHGEHCPHHETIRFNHRE
jgi:hypothetical protein